MVMFILLLLGTVVAVAGLVVGSAPLAVLGMGVQVGAAYAHAYAVDHRRA